jgi:hypothetical protein
MSVFAGPRSIDKSFENMPRSFLNMGISLLVSDEYFLRR